MNRSINKKTTLSLLVSLLMVLQLFGQELNLKTGSLKLSFNDKGQITSLSNPLTGGNYLASGQDASLLRVRVKGKWLTAERASWDKQKKSITLTFQDNLLTANVRIIEKSTHLRFELVKLKPTGIVDAISWGPIPVKISETIGEVVGVVRNGDYAIGIQSLNVKTVGGLLKNGEGSESSRGSAAVKQEYGSSLQAYALDRSVERTIDVWCEYFPHYPGMVVAPIRGETVEGSAIALFGCAEKSARHIIGEIELAEGLPHPMINGKWIKESSEAGRAYMISDFNEGNIDSLLNWTNKAGLAGLYHEGPFKSWGHYIIDSTRFPHGNAGVKTCVEKANKLGLRLGVHTLTTFINTNDPYVSPIPDKRLALTGSADLLNEINATTSTVDVSTNQYFNNTVANALHAFRIGNEIIRYKSVTTQPPYQLVNCQRGAYGTKAVSHTKGEKVSMLMDYPYEVFFPNYDLQQEIAGNLAQFFNETGVSQMDFDGHEGCYSSGQGDYSMQAFADKVFRETKHNLVNGTSRSNHYYWHICHYWNWGEPWYGGFRDSQTDQRFEQQALLERNYMPNMLGWFLLSATTSTEDIEWMMARAAGYNAGFALVARMAGLQKNPNTDKILGLIKLWQEAYHQNLFTVEQRRRLKDPKKDFHLEKSGEGFKLYPFTKYSFEYTHQMLQPGQPTFSEWDFTNTDRAQPLSFSISMAGTTGEIINPRIEFDGYFAIELTGSYKVGSSIVCDGSQLKLYNEKGRFVRNIEITSKIPELTTGNHKLKFDCKFSDDSNVKANIVVKTISNPELIASR